MFSCNNKLFLLCDGRSITLKKINKIVNVFLVILLWKEIQTQHIAFYVPQMRRLLFGFLVLNFSKGVDNVYNLEMRYDQFIECHLVS